MQVNKLKKTQHNAMISENEHLNENENEKRESKHNQIRVERRKNVKRRCRGG